MAPDALHAPLHRAMRGDVPVLRVLDARLPLDELLRLMTPALAEVADEGHPHVLVDATACRFASPSLVQRIETMRGWAEALRGRLRLAVVVPPHYLDPDRFGTVVASRFGLTGEGFEREEDALAWLRREREADLRRRGGPAS